MSLIMAEDTVAELTAYLRSLSIKPEDRVMNAQTLKDAHIQCILAKLSAQCYGPLLERYIIEKFGFIKNKASDCIGDCAKDGQNAEIKVSLGGRFHNQFNYVQLRPNHDCAYYILTAYHLSDANVQTGGDLYVFKVPKDGLKALLLTHGQYAHGTVKKLGAITAEKLSDEKSDIEYAIRPKINSPCWQALLAYKVDEAAI